MTEFRTLDLPVEGMTCQECASHVADALKRVPGVRPVHVLVGAERATITYDSIAASRERFAAAIRAIGYRVPETTAGVSPDAGRNVGRVIGWGVLGAVAAVVIVAAGSRPLSPERPGWLATASY